VERDAVGSGAADDLKGLPTIAVEVGQTKTNYYPARIVEPPNRWNRLVIELELASNKSPLTHRFAINRRDIAQWKGLSAEQGQRVLVSIKPDRSDRRRTLEIKSKELSDLAESFRPELVISGEQILAGDKQLSIDTVNALLRLDSDPNWVREVWEFFADSMHVVVDSVRPKVAIVVIPLPSSISQLLKQRRSDVIKAVGVPNGVSVKATDNVVELSGIDQERLAQAASAMGSLIAFPRVQARLPRALPEWL
jgi:hypothetical protein